jgi:nucleotide-binding universal stress UspA family protein
MTTLATPSRISVKNILVPVDLSELSETAVALAGAVAGHFGSKVSVLHVINPSSYVMAPPEAVTVAYDAVRNAAKKGVSTLSDQLHDVPHEAAFVEGDVTESVLEVLKQGGHDLMVLSTHGRTGVSKFFLGSISEELFRSAHCPVLTTGPGAGGRPNQEMRFRNILFATDFSKGSLSALPYALSFAQEEQAKLTLLHVLNPEVEKSDAAATGRIVADMEEGLKRLVPRDAACWCEPKYVVATGHAGETIVKEALARGADLIVMGVSSSQPHLGAAVHLPWAIAHAVVAHAPCPVLTVRSIA